MSSASHHHRVIPTVPHPRVMWSHCQEFAIAHRHGVQRLRSPHETRLRLVRPLSRHLRSGPAHTAGLLLGYTVHTILCHDSICAIRRCYLRDQHLRTTGCLRDVPKRRLRWCSRRCSQWRHTCGAIASDVAGVECLWHFTKYSRHMLEYSRWRASTGGVSVGIALFDPLSFNLAIADAASRGVQIHPACLTEDSSFLFLLFLYARQRFFAPCAAKALCVPFPRGCLHHLPSLDIQAAAFAFP